MFFKEALKFMRQGVPVKLPSWGGYWYWSNEKNTIMMCTKEGDYLDIRSTDRVVYTLENILSDEWIIATSDNCPILGGIALFSFSDALKYLYRELKVARQGWNGKGMYIFLSPSVGCQIYKDFTGKSVNDLKPFIVMKAADSDLVPWVASQTDLLANDWIIVE